MHGFRGTPASPSDSPALWSLWPGDTLVEQDVFTQRGVQPSYLLPSLIPTLSVITT